MGQFRAAVRQKNQQRSDERRKLLRPTLAALVLIACVQYNGHKARIARIGRIMGGYILDRLFAPSFAERVMPVLPASSSGRLVFKNPRRHNWTPPWQR